MSSPGPLSLDHNPFADDHDEHTDVEHPLAASSGSDGNTKHSGGVADPDLAGLEQQHWDDQDQHLDALSASLNRQHEMSLQMDQELDLHQELLEGFDGDVDRTGLRIGGAANQMDRLRSSLRDHGE